MRKRIMKLATSIAIATVMLLSAGISSFATAPHVKEVEFKNNGRIEVEFAGKVKYQKVAVTVKDASGKQYKVKNIRKDDDDIKFTVNNFKRGKTYNITVSGVKVKGRQKFGKVTARLKVPAAATGKAITKNTAISTAKKHAKNTWKASKLWDIDVESDRYQGQAVWEVSFDGTIDGVAYEFEYKIAKNGGKILKQEKELDD